jgi:hypothetical protein
MKSYQRLRVNNKINVNQCLPGKSKIPPEQYFIVHFILPSARLV